MNNRDCWNQRTGQPRCVQLMAKTWNFSPSTLRTQQGTSLVSPSQGLVTGFRNTANLVFPSGKWFKSPSDTQVRGEFLENVDRTYPKTGTPINNPASAFRPAPSLSNRLRRDTDGTAAASVSATLLQPQPDS